MSATKLLAIAMSIALLITGLTAVAAAPPDAGGELPGEAHENAERPDEPDGDATPNESTPTGPDVESIGPPAGLPDAVPEFVSDIHGAIEAHLEGTIEDLGDAIRSIVPGSG